MEIFEFGNIANFSQGQQVSINDQQKEIFDGADRFLRIVNYTQNSTDFRYIKAQPDRYKVGENDIIMVRYGAVGFIGRGHKGVLANNMFKVNFDQERVNSKYLFRALWAPQTQSQIIGAAQSTSMAALNFNSIRRIKIPLPPLKTQQKIAAILDEADKLRQLDKKLIKKYEALSQSLFLEMFGDIIKNPRNFQEYKLENVCDEIFLGLTSKVEYVDNGGYPLIRAKDIRYGELKFDKVKFISKEQHERITKKRITKRGDVLISKSGSLGTCAIVNSDREFTTYESIFTVRVDQLYLTNIFLTELLRNESFKMKLLGNKVGGTVAHLNLKMFRDFIIPVPPISLQKEFANKISKIENQLWQARNIADQSEELFNSLLQKAFKGELV